MLWEILRAGDHSWREGSREVHPLPSVEFRVLKGRETLDLVEEGRGESCRLDEEALREHGADL